MEEGKRFLVLDHKRGESHMREREREIERERD